MPAHKETLHSGVRQYLHRMIICLGDELLNYVPMAITLLLKDCQVSVCLSVHILAYNQNVAYVSDYCMHPYRLFAPPYGSCQYGPYL